MARDKRGSTRRSPRSLGKSAFPNGTAVRRRLASRVDSNEAVRTRVPQGARAVPPHLVGARSSPPSAGLSDLVGEPASVRASLGDAMHQRHPRFLRAILILCQPAYLARKATAESGRGVLTALFSSTGERRRASESRRGCVSRPVPAVLDMSSRELPPAILRLVHLSACSWQPLADVAAIDDRARQPA